MKPIGGIVANKKSIHNNFEQVERFTTEELNKLWKVYSVNRDVIEKGHRLENLFWRIWSSERSGRPFSGRVVAAMFMAIYSSDDLLDRRKASTKPPISATPRTASQDTASRETTPRHSLEVECPPTPPPSPAPPNSATAQPPPHNEITAGIEQAFPPPPPSPPVPTDGSESIHPPLVLVPSLPKGGARIAKTEQELPVALPRNQYSPSVSDSRTSPTLVSGSGSYQSTSSMVSSSSGSSENVALAAKGRGGTNRQQQARGSSSRGARGRPPARGANRTRGIRPPLPRKSSSSSNTVVNTTVNSPTEPLAPTADMAQSFPAAKKLPPRRQDSIVSEPEVGTTESGSRNWIVDPNFRSKFLDQKKGLDALKAITPPTKTGPTTTVTKNIVTTHSSKAKGRKRMLVVDGVAPLKGVEEEDEGESSPGINGGSNRRKLDPMGVKDGILPSVLVRRNKSELSTLLETDLGKSDSTKGSMGSKQKESSLR